MNPTKADLTEHQIQSCVMEWADGQLALHPEMQLLYAIPNGNAIIPQVAQEFIQAYMSI